MDDERIAALLSETPAEPDLPRAAWDDLNRRAVRRRLRRRVAGAAAGLFVAAGVALPLLLLSPLRGLNQTPSADTPSPASPTPAQTAVVGEGTLDAYGLRVELPQGWEGLVFRRPPGADPTLILSNATLYGEVDDGAQRTRRELGPQKVVVVLFETTWLDPCEEYPAVESPYLIREQDLKQPEEWRRVEPGHEWAHRLLGVANRCFALEAEFGSAPVPGELLAEANEVLGTLAIERAPEEPRPSPSPPEELGDGNVVWIVCTEDGTEVRTPEVSVQPDGVHLHIDNVAKADFVEFREPGATGGTAIEFSGQTVVDTVLRLLGPGSYEASCWGVVSEIDVFHRGDIPPDEYEPISFTDPDGLWSYHALTCDTDREVVRGQGLVESHAELVETIREVVERIHPTDRVIANGYPEQDRWIAYRVERGGDVVMTIQVAGSPGLPIGDPVFIVTACAGSGIGNA